MTVITRELLRTIRTDLSEQLKVLGERHGVAITLANNTTFDSTQAKFAVNILTDAEGETNTNVIMFNRYHEILGVSATALNATYVNQGKTYKVITLDINKRKYPIIVESGGKRYKVALSHLPEHLHS